MFIQVKAVGSVERDPELHIIEGDTQVTDFSLAVNTKRCREDITIRLNCFAWGSLAETVERLVTKGSLIVVEGGFTTNQHEHEASNEDLSFEVNIEKFFVASENDPEDKDLQTRSGKDDPYCAY
jgi:single stranded DNA-binding protein